MVNHTQTIRLLLPTNCLSVSEHFVGLALKGLKAILNFQVRYLEAYLWCFAQFGNICTILKTWKTSMQVY